MMRRRDFLRAVAALAAVPQARPITAQPAQGPKLRVGVVGGGIVGASIAYHVALRGAAVTVFDKGQLASGATQNSFAWLNAFVADPAYRALRLQSLARYHALDRALALDIVWGGYINWARADSEIRSLRDAAAQMASTPFPVRAIDAREFARLAPVVVAGPVSDAFYSRIDGHLDPVHATRRFAAAAQSLGAQVRLQTKVLDLASNGAAVSVQTREGRSEFDRLVIAAGVDAPPLLAKLGFALALHHAPGILAHSDSLPLQTPTIFDAPGTLSFKQMSDGSVVGTDSPGPPDIEAHRLIRAGRTDFPTPKLREMHGRRILNKIAQCLPAAKDVPLRRLTLGFRPMPTDELPVVGAVPGAAHVFVAVTHSGVTLAPILGMLLSDEVVTDPRHLERSPALAPFRPERFTHT